jgi:hypothetical protein
MATEAPESDVLAEDRVFCAWGKLHAEAAHHSGARVTHEECVLFK